MFELEREREHDQVRLREADQLQAEVGPVLLTALLAIRAVLAVSSDEPAAS